MIKRVLSGTALQIGSILVMVVERVLLTALLIRVWGLAGFEDWTVLFNAAGLFAIFELGLQMSFSNAFARIYESGDKEAFKRATAVARTISVAVLCLGMAVLAAVAYLHETPFSVTSLDQPHATLVFAVLSLAILIGNLSVSTITIYRAQRKYTRGFGASLLLAVLRLLAVVPVVMMGLGPVSAALAYLAATALFVLVLVPMDLKSKLGDIEFGLVWPRLPEVKQISATAPWFLAQHSINTILQSVPVLAVAGLEATGGALASFVILRTLSNMVRQIISALGNSLSIELSAAILAGTGQPDHAGKLRRSVKLFTVINTVALGCLLILAEPFVDIWSAGSVSANMDVALALCAGLLVSGPFIGISHYLNYIGEARIGAFARLVQGLTVMLTGAVTAHLGALGIAIAVGAGEAVGGGLIYLRNTAAKTELALFRLTAMCLGYTVAAALPMLSVGLAASSLNFASSVTDFIIRGLLTAPIALLTILVLATTTEDRDRLKRGLQGFIPHRIRSQ